LTALAVLYLDENLLTGTIPWLPHSLIDLRLSQNSLNGSIHRDFGDLQRLQVCYLDSNRLSGKLPENAIGTLKQLRELHLYDNDLTGPIPTTIGNLELLRVLYLDGNDISGSIPPEVGGMPHLGE
jgi:Leucine-rich repeat (LRR) protein